MSNIRSTIPTDIEYELIWRSADGAHEKTATEAHLLRAGFIRDKALRTRAAHLFGLAGFDINSDDEGVSIIRYMMEYLVYDWDPDEDAMQRFGDAIRAINEAAERAGRDS